MITEENYTKAAFSYEMPTVYVIAGPNGAGKTTFAREFLPFYAQCVEFLNADLIAAGLSPFDPTRSAALAGRAVGADSRAVGSGAGLCL